MAGRPCLVPTCPTCASMVACNPPPCAAPPHARHAELLAHDQEVAHTFAKHCYTGYDQQEGR